MPDPALGAKLSLPHSSAGALGPHGGSRWPDNSPEPQTLRLGGSLPSLGNTVDGGRQGRLRALGIGQAEAEQRGQRPTRSCPAFDKDVT